MGMCDFWRMVRGVIHDVDVVLLLLDSRFAEDTRNAEIEKMTRKLGKPLIYVITKSDLTDKKILEKLKGKLRPSVFVSVRDRRGLGTLRERIIIEGSRAYDDVEVFRVGVLGYPNVGKSSLINALKGKHSASTSAMSGHTKAVQWLRADNRILLMDTPGVIPVSDKDDMKKIATCAIDYSKAKDPETAAKNLMKARPGMVERHYGVAESDDKEETIEAIALKRNMLAKGGIPDVHRASRTILMDWQKGNIKP